MRILLVTNYFEPDQGAASIILTRLAKRLHARGHDVTVLTSLPNYPYGRVLDGYRGKFAVVEERDGVRVVQTWLWATPSPRISRKFISQISFMLTAVLRGLFLPRPDVMLVEAQPIFTNLAGVLLSRFKRVPYVLDVHDLWPDHMLSVGALTADHPVYRVARWLVDRTYFGASGIVALSPAWAEAIQRIVPDKEKVHVVYNGTDPEQLHPGADGQAFRDKHGLGNGKLVTFIGTLATQYDFETMVNTTRYLADRPDIQFVFIGSGTQTEYMQQLLAQHAGIRWIEWVDYAEIPQAWAASDVTYWAMRDQALYRGTIPTKWYEALATGTPVAAACNGIIPDLLQASGAGRTVLPGDAEGLAQIIRQLLDQPMLNEICRKAGRAYAEAHFDMDQVAAAYETMFEKVR